MDEPQTNKSIITWVVVTLAVNATIGVCTLGYVLIRLQKPDPVIFTAFVAIVNYILGVLSGMLAKTSPTETTKQPPPPQNGSHVTATIDNPPSYPVQTEETKTPCECCE